MAFRFDKAKIKQRLKDEFESASYGMVGGFFISQFDKDFLSITFVTYVGLRLMDKLGLKKNLTGLALGTIVGINALNPAIRQDWIDIYNYQKMLRHTQEAEQPEGVMAKNNAAQIRGVTHQRYTV